VQIGWAQLNIYLASLEVFTAVWLWTPFLWDMTPRYWVIGVKDLEEEHGVFLD
jgi:hypothetical protein